MAETTIKGLADLQKLLDTLPAKIEANIMRGALRAGAKLILDTAKTNVPTRTGALRDSLRIKTAKKGGTVSATVTAGGKTKNGGNAFYAHMVEYGTEPHVIEGRNGGFLSFNGTSVRSVDHPGAQARPFMRPALDANQNAAVVAMGEYIKQRLASKQGLDTSYIMIEGDE